MIVYDACPHAGDAEMSGRCAMYASGKAPWRLGDGFEVGKDWNNLW